MEIVPPNERHTTLEKAGVAPKVLSLIDSIGQDTRKGARLGMVDPTAAYYYLDREWEPFAESDVVTPVFSNPGGDVFVVFVRRIDGSRSFVFAGLEEGVLIDYGPCFGCVVLDLLVRAYEAHGWSKAELLSASEDLAFDRGLELYRELQADPRTGFDESDAFMNRMRNLFFP